jgi:hypothetical protein
MIQRAPLGTAFALPLLVALSLLTGSGPLRGEEKEGKEKARDLAAERQREEKCLECHDDDKMQGGGPRGVLKSVFVDPAKYRASVHTKKDLTCFSCHPDAEVDYHPRGGVTIRACGDCHDHEEENREFLASRHGLSLLRGDRNAANCQDCHGNHYILTREDPSYRMRPENVGPLCLKCHPGRGTGGLVRWVAGRRVSAHGKQDLSHDYSPGQCTLCHYGSHTHKTPEEAPLCGSCHLEAYTPEGKAVGNVHLGTEGFAALWQGIVRGGGFLVSLLLVLVVLLPAAGAARRFLKAGEKKIEETEKKDE